MLYIIILVFLVWLYVRFVLVSLNVPKSQEKTCPPHIWTLAKQPGDDVTYYLKCSTCNKLPGEDPDAKV